MRAWACWLPQRSPRPSSAVLGEMITTCIMIISIIISIINTYHNHNVDYYKYVCYAYCGIIVISMDVDVI